ncbi:MAG TPA: selenoneine biosynthesis selenosugar synthase SenB [Vicinamibacteria bacterium]|nr:selenoneine biosynthesis selenosugar synthase SenB [Vicinamibacteria bacterium]
MKICLVTPARPRSLTGNRVTALRWARLLGQLGHRVTVVEEYEGQTCDLMLALHARKSARSIEKLAEARPGTPVVLAMTGTDLYTDVRKCPVTRLSMELAAAIVVLQPEGLRELPDWARPRARAILQSAEPVAAPRPRRDGFEVALLAHLRPVKDPFRAAMAARLLPAGSRVRIVHAGAALDADLEQRARSEQASNPRYRWLGELPRWRARRVLARSRALVITSRSEGGANVLSEALASGVPVLSSRIPGSTGILGTDYPGLFAVGDTHGLAALLQRAEGDGEFHRGLAAWCRRLAPLVEPARERRAWRDLLAECSGNARRTTRGRPRARAS